MSTYKDVAAIRQALVNSGRYEHTDPKLIDTLAEQLYSAGIRAKEVTP